MKWVVAAALCGREVGSDAFLKFILKKNKEKTRQRVQPGCCVVTKVKAGLGDIDEATAHQAEKW